MAGRSLRCFPVALVAFALLGCGDIEEARKELADKYRSAIEGKLAAWPILAKQLRDLPPLAEHGLAGAHALVVDTFTAHDQMPNAALCYAEDLANPDELGYVWARLPDTGRLNHCASFLHRGHLAYDPAQPETRLQRVSLAEGKWRYPQCAGYRYLLVIRTLEFLEPSAASAATEPFVPVTSTQDLDAPPPSKSLPKAKTEKPAARPAEAEPEVVEKLMPVRSTGTRKEMRYLFEGGFLRAELLAFELPTGKLLGGVRFSAQNGVVVDGRGDGVRTDFQLQVRKAVERALAQLAQPVPGGQGP
jgi:hypothetical protein